MPVNDGTNACAFLSVSISERILRESETNNFFENLPDAVESTIWSLPAKNQQALGSRQKLWRPWSTCNSSTTGPSQVFLGFLRGAALWRRGVYVWRERKAVLKTLCSWYWPLHCSVHKRSFCAYHWLSWWKTLYHRHASSDASSRKWQRPCSCGERQQPWCMDVSLCVALETTTSQRSGSKESSVISSHYTGNKVSVLGVNLLLTI